MTNCVAKPCPILLNSTCVFYSGANLLYTGITTNDNLQTALEKIDLKFKDASIGYIFQDGIIQVSPGDPVTLGGIFTQDVTISNGPYNFLITNNLEAGAHVTTGGTSSDFVKGDGSLDGSSYQPSGSYITGLTGDGFANGPGVATFTLDNVNPTTGVFGSSTRVPIITTNSKGLITNITTTVISLPSSSLNFIGDVSGSGSTGSLVTLTLATVNPDVYLSDSFLKFAVNGKGLITSASSVNSTDIIGVIGYTPVPESRTLTINGVTYDLTLDRSWTIPLLPSQSGNNGYFLQTDGSSPSWQPININPGTVTSVSVINGTGINASVTNSTSTPTITITNTLPDQVVSLSSGSGINVTGSYPSFTIINTAQPAANTVTGTGTFNYLPKWGSTVSTLVDSLINDNSSGVMIGTTSYDYYKLDVNGSARVRTNFVVGPVYPGSILVDTNYGLRVNTPMSGAGTTFGILADGEVQSDSVNNVYYFRSIAKTAATAFTVQDLHHFIATQNTFGAGSSVNYQWGFRVFSNMVGGAVSNRAFSGELPVNGTKNWNLHMSGTAPNHLTGNLLIGSTSDNGNKLQVTGTSNMSNTLTISSSVTNTVLLNLGPTVLTNGIQFQQAGGANRVQLKGFNAGVDSIRLDPGAFSFIGAGGSGNVAIGSSTDDTVNKLQVTGSIANYFSNIKLVIAESVTSTVTLHAIGTSTTPDASNYFIRADGSSTFVNASSSIGNIDLRLQNGTFGRMYKTTGNFALQNVGSSYVDDLTNRLQVDGSIKATQYRLSALNTAPASATATGTLGEIRIDANFIYICVATNTWKRAAISTW